ITRREPETDLMLLAAWSSIGLGFVLLYFVPAAIASVIPTVRIYFGAASGVAYIVFTLFLADSMLAASKRRELQYPGRKLIRPLYVVGTLGIVLAFGSFAVDFAIPSLSSDLTTWWLPLLGIAVVLAPLLAMRYLQRKWRGLEPRS